MQEIFIAHLLTLDEASRTGEEWTNARRSDYEIVRVPIHQLDSVDLKPGTLQRFTLDNVDALIAKASALV